MSIYPATLPIEISSACRSKPAFFLFKETLVDTMQELLHAEERRLAPESFPQWLKPLHSDF
jgi:hypothetical protein